MKKSLTRIVAVALVLAVASFALAADGSWTGWVTDTHCAAKGASADHAECATKCVKDKGAKWALYNEATRVSGSSRTRRPPARWRARK